MVVRVSWWEYVSGTRRVVTMIAQYWIVSVISLVVPAHSVGDLVFTDTITSAGILCSWKMVLPAQHGRYLSRYASYIASIKPVQRTAPLQ